MIKEEDIWSVFCEYITSKYPVTNAMLEAVAVNDCTKMSVSGICNDVISSDLGMHSELLEDVLVSYLGFSGWKEGLKFNPYHLYTNTQSKEEFRLHANNHSLSAEEIEIVYNACKKYKDISEKVEEYYERIG